MDGFDLTSWYLSEIQDADDQQRSRDDGVHSDMLSAPPLPDDMMSNCAMSTTMTIAPQMTPSSFLNMDWSLPNDLTFHLPDLLFDDANSFPPTPKLSELPLTHIPPLPLHVLCSSAFSETSDATSTTTSESDEHPEQSDLVLYMPDHAHQEHNDDHDDAAEASKIFDRYEADEKAVVRLQRRQQHHPARYIKCQSRPHQCAQCGHSFKRLHDYRRHILTHLNQQHHDEEYRWRCSHCHESFTRSYALKRHHGRKHKTLSWQPGPSPTPPPMIVSAEMPLQLTAY